MYTRSSVLCALIVLLACGRAAAQLTPPGKGAASRAGELSLVPDLQVLEVNQSTILRVKATPYVQASNDGNLDFNQPPLNVPNTRSSAMSNVPVIYEVSSWKILEGGGTLKFNNGPNIDFTYKAPATVPANADNRIVQVSVELSPHSVGNGTQGMGKVILLLTLYIVQNETAIVVHMPEAGFNDTKYINNTVGGVSLPGIDSRIPASQSADLQVQRAMAKAQMAQVQQQTGIDLNAITSNAKVIYTADKNFTTIQFTQLSVQVNNKIMDLHPSPSAILTIVFQGKPVKGGHSINLEPDEVGLTTFAGKACTCGKDPKSDPDSKPLPCAGMVVITEVTDKTVKGYIMSRIYYSNNGNKFSGWLNGDFSALLATH